MTDRLDFLVGGISSYTGNGIHSSYLSTSFLVRTSFSVFQRSVGAGLALFKDPSARHIYRLEWQTGRKLEWEKRVEPRTTPS